MRSFPIKLVPRFVRLAVASRFVAIVTLTVLFVAHVSAAEYRITTLDILPGGHDSLAFGINDLGVIVGASTIDRSGNVANARPVMWDASGQPTLLWEGSDVGLFIIDPVTGEVTYEPPVFPGGVAASVNNLGQVVGRAQNSGYTGIPLPTPGIPSGVAFYWDPVQGRRELGTLGGGSSEATGINDAGQVAGSAENAAGLPRAFRWTAEGGMQDLGTLGGDYAFANAINAQGQIVGYSSTATGQQHAFLWDPVTGMQDLQDLQDGLPGESRAFGLNGLGEVVGELFDIGRHAFLYSDTRTLGPIQLNLGHAATARAVSDTALVIGESSDDDRIRGFVWDPVNGGRNLEDLIPPNAGWQIETAFGLNDRGEIVGYGIRDETIRGYAITPVPEPAASLLLGVGLLWLLGGWMMRRAA